MKIDLVIIVGMHRSGTSALGKLLHKLGFYFGNNLLAKIQEINADGFWEDEFVVSINEALLKQLGSAWYSFMDLPPQWWRRPEITAYHDEVDKWYVENFESRSPVCIKDPRFCRTLPFWLDYFYKKQITPKIIFSYRHPYSVAASLKKRDNLSLEVACLLWLTYTLEALEYTRHHLAASVCYDYLVRRPIDLTTTLLTHTFNEISGLKRQRIARQVSSIIDPNKNNHPIIESTHEARPGVYGALAEELYRTLEKTRPEQLASIADEYRHRFNRLLANEKILPELFQQEVNDLVQANQKLSELGEAHTFALDTIAKKDRIYEVSLAGFEKRIAGNKTYIKKCHARIREQDVQLKKLGQKSQQVEHLESCLKDRENKIAENVSYIQKCEERIRQQDQLLLERQRSSLLWPLLCLRRKVRALFAKPPVL